MSDQPDPRDFSALSDGELSRRIAELQGWHSHSAYVGKWIMVAPPFRAYTREDYMELHRGGINHATEAETWQDAPDYVSDLNAAAELLQECGGSLAWDTYSIEWECSIPKGRDEYHAATHPTNPARAICEVWLAWKRSKE